MTHLDRLDRVVSDLERDQNLPRIKKLLYCSCYGVWEDDVTRLERVTLREIARGVWERSPTLDALQFQLNRIVKTLNKPVEYAHVANSILRVMTQLYRDTYDITRPLGRPTASPAPATQWLGAEPAKPPMLSPAELEAHVVQALLAHAEQIRLKKLLLCVCKNIWENDPARLMAQNWTDLLRETQDLIPTLENLDYVLQAIVKSLSKPLDYLPIASTLIQSIRPLYENRPKPTDTLFYGIDNSPSRQQPESTQFYESPVYESPAGESPAGESPVHESPAHQSPAYEAPVYEAPAPATGPLHGLNGLTPSLSLTPEEIPTGLLTATHQHATPQHATPQPFNSPERFPPSLMEGRAGESERTTAKFGVGEFAGEEVDEGGELDLGEFGELSGRSPQLVPALGHPAETAPGSAVALAPLDTQDDFGLRLELLRYANPLMVKIVLFSAIHRLFRFSEQDWTELRHHTLLGLVATLRSNYPNFTDVETKLCLTAESIELKENALKTVAALLKVLRPYYGEPEGDQRPERQFMLPHTTINSLEDDLDLLAAALEDDENADENSCQVF